MKPTAQTTDDRLVLDLQRELARLEVERAELLKRRDGAMMVVETGDDSGFMVSLLVNDVKRIDERIEQVKNLLAKYAPPS